MYTAVSQRNKMAHHNANFAAAVRWGRGQFLLRTAQPPCAHHNLQDNKKTTTTSSYIMSLALGLRQVARRSTQVARPTLQKTPKRFSHADATPEGMLGGEGF